MFQNLTKSAVNQHWFDLGLGEMRWPPPKVSEINKELMKSYSLDGVHYQT